MGNFPVVPRSPVSTLWYWTFTTGEVRKDSVESIYNFPRITEKVSRLRTLLSGSLPTSNRSGPPERSEVLVVPRLSLVEVLSSHLVVTVETPVASPPRSC